VEQVRITPIGGAFALVVVEGPHVASGNGVAGELIAVGEVAERAVRVPVQREASATDAQLRILWRVAGVGADRAAEVLVLGAGAVNVDPPVGTMTAGNDLELMSMYRLAFREPPAYTGEPAASAVMFATNSATPSVAAPRQNLRNMTNTYPGPRGATHALRTGARVRLRDPVPLPRVPLPRVPPPRVSLPRESR